MGSVVLAQYSGQSTAEIFRKRLESLGVKVFLHYPIEGYPSNIPHIISEEGFGKNQYVETSRPPCGGYGSGPRKRKNGYLPFPALP